MLKKCETYLGYFILCAFIGWLYEEAWEIFINGNWVNRGVLYGPYLPVYGFGGILIIALLNKLAQGKDLKERLKKLPLLFILIMLLTSALELVTSYICEYTIGYIPWDYTQYKFTIDHRVSLLNSTIFGLGGIIFLYIVKPLIDKFVSKVSPKVLNILSIIILVILGIDCIFSFLIK